MRIIILFLAAILLFLIFFSMLCSCKKNKLNKILTKIYKKILELLNDLIHFLNVDGNNSNIKRKMKNRGGNNNLDNDFPDFLGPSHNRS